MLPTNMFLPFCLLQARAHQTMLGSSMYDQNLPFMACYHVNACLFEITPKTLKLISFLQLKLASQTLKMT